MIKCEVTCCGVISRSAEVKENKETQEKFLTFKMKYPVKDRSGETKELEISVSMPGDKGQAQLYTSGRRVRVSGTLYLRKRKDTIFFNLRNTGGDILANSKDEDSLEGTMEFTGKIGKKGVDEKNDRKGNPYKAFSAYSSEKTDGDKREFIWCRFLYFDPKPEGEDFLKAEGTVECKGDLRLGVFKGAISLECILKEVNEWVLPEKKEAE